MSITGFSGRKHGAVEQIARTLSLPLGESGTIWPTDWRLVWPRLVTILHPYIITVLHYYSTTLLHYNIITL